MSALDGVAALVVTGVAGAGKSTVGAALAARLGCEFRDADSFHPPANIAKMKSGTPLTDADRAPWLASIAAWIDGCRETGRLGVVACSALKRRYRDVLTGGRRDVRIVYLKGERALIARRLAARRGHFMPAALLASQFDALEEPGPDEAPIVAAIDAAPEAIVAQVVAELGERRGQMRGVRIP